MMKVRIEDKEALAALSIESLRAYLDRDNRWTYAEDIPGKAAVYQHKDKTGRLREVIVPLRRDFADYAARMGDAVATLGRVEDRSELDIYNDLRAPDVTREVHERIRRWLAEEGWTIEDVGDPECSFNVMATLKNGNRVNIFQRQEHRDHITVSVHAVFTNTDESGSPQIPEDVRQEIAWVIERDTLSLGLDFVSPGLTPMQTRFASFIYFDGLSKDALIEKVTLVLRATAYSGRVIGRGFKAAGLAPDAVDDLTRPENVSLFPVLRAAG